MIDQYLYFKGSFEYIKSSYLSFLIKIILNFNQTIVNFFFAIISKL